MRKFCHPPPPLNNLDELCWEEPTHKLTTDDGRTLELCYNHAIYFWHYFPHHFPGEFPEVDGFGPLPAAWLYRKDSKGKAVLPC